MRRRLLRRECRLDALLLLRRRRRSRRNLRLGSYALRWMPLEESLERRLGRRVLLLLFLTLALGSALGSARLFDAQARRLDRAEEPRYLALELKDWKAAGRRATTS